MPSNLFIIDEAGAEIWRMMIIYLDLEDGKWKFKISCAWIIYEQIFLHIRIDIAYKIKFCKFVVYINSHICQTCFLDPRLRDRTTIRYNYECLPETDEYIYPLLCYTRILMNMWHNTHPQCTMTNNNNMKKKYKLPNIIYSFVYENLFYKSCIPG